ncbi:hypothetical protein GCM10007285_23190 [Stappia taiwanensis]|nr:hypothetical protein GCM10007285_23190 [Stappia taiwanensis]
MNDAAEKQAGEENEAPAREGQPIGADKARQAQRPATGRKPPERNARERQKGERQAQALCQGWKPHRQPSRRISGIGTLATPVPVVSGVS